MSKTYKDIHEEPIMASEPVAAYGEPTTYAMPSKSVPAKERVMSSTVSVDEYFDELITSATNS